MDLYLPLSVYKYVIKTVAVMWLSLNQYLFNQ